MRGTARFVARAPLAHAKITAMRLTPRQVSDLKQCAEQAFGASAHLRLFGSRAVDSKRGGDIDLLVRGVHLDADQELDAKIEFLVMAKRLLGDQRIDVVFAPKDGEPQLPIHQEALREGVPL